MTYEAGFFMALIFGLSIGHWIFQIYLPTRSDEGEEYMQLSSQTPCCGGSEAINMQK
jgi:hypothetical protein